MTSTSAPRETLVRDILPGDVLVSSGRTVIEVDLTTNVHGLAIIRSAFRGSHPTASTVIDPSRALLVRRDH